MNNARFIFGPMRLPFLIVTPACVLLGIATAVLSKGQVNPWQVALVLIGAVAAHISVNALNEYSDCKTGLDARTRRTPFSGGSGAFVQNPEKAHFALVTGLAALGIVVAVGVYFLIVRGWGLLPVGLLGILVVVAYTPWIGRYPLLCLISPGLGFGLCMVLGAHFSLSGNYTWTAFVASLIPFFLVSNLLLINQFPDKEADQTVGRRHLPIVLGRGRSSLVYGAFLACTYLAILAGVLWAGFPKLSLLGLATIFLAVPTALAARRHAEDIPKLVPYLGLNVLIDLLTPLLVAVGMLLG